MYKKNTRKSRQPKALAEKNFLRAGGRLDSHKKTTHQQWIVLFGFFTSKLTLFSRFPECVCEGLSFLWSKVQTYRAGLTKPQSHSWTVTCRPWKKKVLLPPPKRNRVLFQTSFFSRKTCWKLHEESHISAPRVRYRKVLRPCDSFIAFLFPLDLDTSNFSKGGSTVHSWEWGRLSDNETYNWITAGYTPGRFYMGSPTLITRFRKGKWLIGTHQTSRRELLWREPSR